MASIPPRTPSDRELSGDTISADHASPVRASAQGATMTGAELIAAERQRQVEAEGWTYAHDLAHTKGELRDAAISYALVCDPRTKERTTGPAWPWESHWWKPSSDPVRNLVKAGALIAAEIDRLQQVDPTAPVRASAQEPQMTGSVWIVLVGEGSFQKCYGTFDSYDAAVDWLRENQLTPAECGIHPVNGYDDVRKN